MEDSQELQDLIHAVVQSQGSSAGTTYDRYKAIVAKYQEQPQLLDGCLEGIVQPLAVLLRQAAMSSTAQDTARVRDVCRMLHVLVSVRGYKTVVRFFPHEAQDLERVLQVLGYVTDQQAAVAAGADSGSGSSGLWEAQAVLLLWLSILVLIPFDLVILDSEVTGGESSKAAAQQGYPPLAGKIMALCQGYLKQPGAVREMAALLLARLLTRPDMAAALTAFLAWQQAALAAAAGPAAVFLLPGVLQVLALVFKLGRREQLLPLAPAVWQQLAELLGDDGSSGSGSSGLGSNALARKLAVKLAQRVGLVLLPPQLAGWRHIRAAADLGSNLAAGPRSAAPPSAQQEPQQQREEGSAAAAAEAAADEPELEVPEQIEEVLGVLLGSCSDRDTIVRWSAAKGVGRLAARLPLELAEEVVEGAMGLLAASEPDSSWHGGCLAIAELARRSILSPARLPAVTALLQAALAYDVRRGPHSVGAHVRDAAAYVCWALARAYEPAQLAGCVSQLAASLLVVACYDREVNCRRAAASAFQESVGRLGSFPHGLEILAVADYYSVGSIVSAYLRVAPFVAGFGGYCVPLLQHLLAVKLRHWDKGLRALAAAGLAALAPVAAGRLRACALPVLLRLVTHEGLEVRAGAVLGLAELLPALAAAGVSDLCSEGADDAAAGEAAALAAAAGVAVAGAAAGQQEGQGSAEAGVVGVLGRLEAAGLYRGRGGELMREAAARFVEQLAAAVGGLAVVPLVAGAPSKRAQAERSLQQQEQGQQEQESQHQRRAAAAAGEGDDGDAGSEAASDDGACDDDDSCIQGGKQQQQVRRPRLQLPLTDAYHAAALRLVHDCLSHVQASIQAGGVAALRAHAAAFQADPQQRPALLGLVAQCCSRLHERDVLPAARRGAAAALGVLPAGLLAGKAAGVLATLAAAAQAPLDPVQGFDIETRIAAVSSLASLSLELVTAGSSSSGPDGGLPLAVLADTVCPTLLAALEDYSRDNRGDVGSWVREAAMDGLTQLVLLLGGLVMQQQQQETQQQQEESQQQQQLAEAEADAAAVLSQGVASLQLQPEQRQPGAAAAQRQQQQQQLRRLHCRVSLLLVGGLLRQSLERIARLREAALIHLASLLAQPAAAAAAVPGAAAIAAALPGDAAELAGVASLACVPRLGQLLGLSWYRRPLLEGLVASVGGVDASLAKAAGEALLAQVGAVGGDAAAGAARQELRRDVARLLLQAWQQQAGSARLALPLIKTAALLVNHAAFSDLPVPCPPPPPAAAAAAAEPGRSSPSAGDAAAAVVRPADAQQDSTKCSSSSSSSQATFAEGVLQLLKAELRGCSDVPKLLEGAGLMAQLACVPGCSAAAIQSVMVLLVNRFPKVRRHMAEQLYLQILAAQSEDPVDASAAGDAADASSTLQQQRSVLAAVPQEDLEAALDVLLVSAWDGPLEQVRASREELAGQLHIEIRTRKLAKASQAASEGGRAAAVAAVRPAEHESYQSLLDDAARGGGY